MNLILFLFLSSTLISQSFMDAMCVGILLTSIYELTFQKKILITLPNPYFKFFWECFFGVWLLVIGMGLYQSNDFINNFSEWKWILNLYSCYWFLQKIPWLDADINNSGFTHKNLTQLTKKLRPFFWVLFLCLNYGSIGLVLDFDLFKQLPQAHGRRFGGPFDDPMNFAHVYGMYFGLLSALVIQSLSPFTDQISKSIISNFKSFYFPLAKKKKSCELALLTLWSYTAIAILLSLTRGAWIGVTSAFIIISFIRNKKLGSIFLGILTGIFIFLVLSWASFRERIFQASHPSDNYDSERLVLWKTNWVMFTDHPWLGIGHGEYKKYLSAYFEKLSFPANQFQSHAHNQYLQALSNTGLFGFLFYILFICFMMYYTYSAFKKLNHPFLLGSLAAQISFHLGSLTECNFERSKVRIVYLFFIALTLTFIAKHKLFSKNQASVQLHKEIL